MTLEGAHSIERHGQIDSGLPSDRRQESVGLLLDDDLLDHLGGERFDVGGVGKLRVRHDRRRIRVDQDDPVALSSQDSAGLGSRIVEFASLADDDGTGAENEDRMDVGTARHGGASLKERHLKVNALG